MDRERDRSPGSGWLLLGLFIVGLTVGYMIGGSRTPVAGVALPLVFGLAPLGMEALKRRADRERQERIATVLPTLTDPAERNDLLDAMKRPAEPWASPRDVGVALVAIGLGVALGVVGGGLVRVRGVYLPDPAVAPLPWEKDTAEECRVPMSAAVRYVNLREDLLALGYSSEQVSRLYARTRDEWCTPPALPWAVGDESCPISRDAALAFIELQRDLVEMGYPRSAATDLFERTRAQWCRPPTEPPSTHATRRGTDEGARGTGDAIAGTGPASTGRDGAPVSSPPPLPPAHEPGAPVSRPLPGGFVLPRTVHPQEHQLRDIANQRRRLERE